MPLHGVNRDGTKGRLFTFDPYDHDIRISLCSTTAGYKLQQSYGHYKATKYPYRQMKLTQTMDKPHRPGGQIIDEPGVHSSLPQGKSPPHRYRTVLPV